MPDVLFLGDSFDEFIYWTKNDRKIADKIDKLINDIARNGADKGIGKPERLKHKPYWSRRIDDKNRLVYELRDKIVEIQSCKGHYDD